MHQFRGWIIFGTLAAVCALPTLCQGMLSGACSNCHTMHNSEEGVPVAFKLDSSNQPVLTELPFLKLLKTDCIGCHSQPGAETVVNMGDTRIPIVFNMSQPTYPANGSSSSALAGGNFYWVAQNGDQYGHNIQGISGQDLRLGGTVPAPGGDDVLTDECATCHRTLAEEKTGCDGCHVPVHHAFGNNIVTGSEEGWYRFLGSVMQREDGPGSTSDGVSGIEDPDWEQNPSPAKHNTYKGTTASYDTFLNTRSIDQKCAGCHGRFHNETTAGSVWIRHPVNMVIPDSGEFADFINYNPMVPVARQSLSAEDTNFSSINRGSDVVSCISCHRAHGSPYPAMLRWAYRAWPGLDPYTGEDAVNGCAVCHTLKD
jgi:hypothetical protein